MHAVIRSYSGSGAKELFDLLERRKDEVESAMGGVTGFVSYMLMRTTDGGASVTVCADKSGTGESIKMARDWIQQNASELNVAAPEVLEGPVVLKL